MRNAYKRAQHDNEEFPDSPILPTPEPLSPSLLRPIKQEDADMTDSDVDATSRADLEGVHQQQEFYPAETAETARGQDQDLGGIKHGRTFFAWLSPSSLSSARLCR